MQNTAEKQEETPLHRFTSSSIYAEDEGEDTARNKKRLVIAALAIGAFAALLAFSYNKSRQSGGEAVVATVEPKTPYTRIRPDNPEGTDAPYKEMEVYNRASGTADAALKPEKLAPLPEQPMIKKLEKSGNTGTENRSLTEIANSNEEQAINGGKSSPAVALPASKGMEDAKVVLQNAYQQKAGVVAVPLNIKASPEEKTSTSPDSARAVVEESAAVEDKAPDVLTPPKKAVVIKSKQPVVSPHKEKSVSAKPFQKVAVQKIEQTTKSPLKVINAIPEKKPAGVSAPATTPVTGGMRVQLGAFSSEALAKNAWKTLSAKNAGAIGTLNPHVVPVQANGKTLYRLQAGVLENRALADSVCAKLKATNQTCIVAK